MDVVKLRVLVAIAREGSVTAAAEALHYAQPSVSHHLARLEAEVGVPLVQRAGRGIRLTDAGRLLADRAEEILGRISSAQAELDAHAGLSAGRLRLAAFPSALAVLVPPAAARFAARHPDIDLSLREAEPPEALAALRSGDIDLALAFSYEERPEPPLHITTVPLLREPTYLVTSAAQPQRGDLGAADMTPSLADYRNERWIAGCPSCRTHLLDQCLRASGDDTGFTPEIAFETDDYIAAQALVAAGIGVTTLPGLAILAHRNQAVRLAELPGDARQVIAATYGKPPAPLPVQSFLRALTEVTQTLPTWPNPTEQPNPINHPTG